MLARLSSARYRHAYLLIALFLIIVVQPFVQRASPVDVPYLDQIGDITIMDGLLMLTLLAGAYAAATTRRQLITIGTVAGTSALLRILLHRSPNEVLFVSHLLVTIAYFGVVLPALARPFFGPVARVTRDTLFGALSLYLLVGVGWSFVYAALEYFEPGSFAFPATDAGTVGDGTDLQRFLGFSFTTLTTLGYGNIAPTTPRADALTSLEAVLGQIYLAVVVARLVALQTNQSQADRENPPGQDAPSLGR